jgi:putative spermidine/putrescine transport system ATP-binding protein
MVTDDVAGAVELVDVVKTFGSEPHAVVAVAGVTLDIAAGEFFSLLGPSGSGKTTVLRMIAGFDVPTAGTIRLGGRDVTRLAPFDRDVNTVFQDYALFPHMTVQRNVEYGLMVKGVATGERRRRAAEMLEVVRLSGYGNRKPNQLSGGQRQRVALARALVNRPKVLLLDEPLGALDLRLREEMQVELKAIQHEVGITFVFVTHDQGEALSMSTRIAVFNHGRVEQVGAPREVYERPATSFVAGFVGTANVLDPDESVRLLGVRALHSVRPERISVLPEHMSAPSGDVCVDATVTDVQYLGAECRVRADLHVPDGDRRRHLLASVPSDELAGVAIGGSVRLAWPRTAAFVVADTDSRGGDQ